MRSIQLGDWVQFTDEEVEDQLASGGIYYPAEGGDVAHVIAETDDPEWFDLYFERTGCMQTCHVSEFKWIASADAGRKL